MVRIIPFIGADGTRCGFTVTSNGRSRCPALYKRQLGVRLEIENSSISALLVTVALMNHLRRVKGEETRGIDLVDVIRAKLREKAAGVMDR